MSLKTTFEPKEIFVMCYKDRLKCIKSVEKAIDIYYPVRNRHWVARERLKSYIKCLKFFKDETKVESLRMELNRR